MKALVTGGSRGIGRAVALRFARQGWDVAITYRSKREAAEETLRLGGDEGGVLIAKKLDVRDSDAVDRVVDEVIGELDGLDVVVNNAGIMENQAAAMMSDEAWESVIATNLTGPFFVCRAVLTHFLMQRFGRIVNLSSVAQDGSAGQANYAASKAGLVGLTKSLAQEYGPRGITANAVAPGLIETEMTAEVTAEVRERWVELCPAGRLGSAEEVAEAVWSLSRREASFINGAVLHVSGGF